MDNFIEHLYAKFLECHGISIDTRSLVPGDLFFGISGPNFNGNSYAKKAISSGASFAVVDEKKYLMDNRIIFAENSLTTLQDLAKYHRNKFDINLLGLTGSNGKTTTKELIRRVLEKRFVVHATSGNFNNHLGVPLTLLGLNSEIEIGPVI